MTRPASPSRTRPFYWSVRRELWEHRSLYIAPLVVTAFALFGAFISLFFLPGKLQSAGPDPVKQLAAVAGPLSHVAAVIMLTTFLVGIFHALDALYGERRDRSILFWKSLPVSDRTTVLSKASIPLLALPLLGFALSMIPFVVLLPLSTAILLGVGESPAAVWGELRILQQPLVMLYGLTAHTLWYAPIYAWLLLVSAWARRMPVLWAAVPPLALAALEKMAFDTSYFASWLGYRWIGAMEEAFTVDAKKTLIYKLAQLDPAGFLSAPGLWSGLVFAAVCLAGAVRLRRYREPIG